MGSIVVQDEILYMLEPGISPDEYYSRAIDFLKIYFYDKVGFCELDNVQNSLCLKQYGTTDVHKSAYSKVLVSLGDDRHPFNLCLHDSNTLIVSEEDYPEFDKFFKVYRKISKFTVHIIFPVIHKDEKMGVFVFDCLSKELANGILLRDKDIYEFITIFTYGLKNLKINYTMTKKYLKYKNLHVSSLTLNKLYMDNSNEILKMTLLSMSGIVEANIYILLIYNRKTESIQLHKLYKHGTELDMNQIILPDSEKKNSVFLFECKEPTIYSFRDISFSDRVGFHGRQIIVLPKFELQENKYVLMLGRNSIKVFSDDEINVLNAFSEVVKISLDNSYLYHRMANQERLEKEVEIASDIQLNLLPRETPKLERFDFSGIMIPAREIGGDYYDFLPSSDKTEVIFAIGDVSGKGVPAGMVMATARTIVHTIIRRKISLNEIIKDLNAYLYLNYKNSVILRFMSLTLLNLITSENKILFAGGGHGNILIYRNNLEEVEIVPTGGMVLGISLEIPDSHGEIQIEKGDILLLYTDGVTECMNPKGEAYEEERLIDAFKRNHNLSSVELLRKIYEDINHFVGSENLQHDDITLVALKRNV